MVFGGTKSACRTRDTPACQKATSPAGRCDKKTSCRGDGPPRAADSRPCVFLETTLRAGRSLLSPSGLSYPSPFDTIRWPPFSDIPPLSLWDNRLAVRHSGAPAEREKPGDGLSAHKIPYNRDPDGRCAAPFLCTEKGGKEAPGPQTLGCLPVALPKIDRTSGAGKDDVPGDGTGHRLIFS